MKIHHVLTLSTFTSFKSLFQRSEVCAKLTPQFTWGVPVDITSEHPIFTLSALRLPH